MITKAAPPYSRKLTARRKGGFISVNDIFIFVGSKAKAFDCAENHFNRLHDVLVLTLVMEPAQYCWSVVKNKSVLVFDLTVDGYPTPLIKRFALVLLSSGATVVRWMDNGGKMTKYTQ